MAQFDAQKAYAPQEAVFFDDGRELELLEYARSRSDLQGSPEKVLQAIDEFGRTKKYLMNVGEDKGKIVSNLIAQTKPKIMVGDCGILHHSS
jgi:catechol O-methyltransferase